MEIRNKTASEILTDIFELTSSSDQQSQLQINRSKIMLVGFAEVGKTTLLGNLFPMKAEAIAEFPSFSASFVKFRGTKLEFFKGEAEKDATPYHRVELNQNSWICHLSPSLTTSILLKPQMSSSGLEAFTLTCQVEMKKLEKFGSTKSKQFFKTKGRMELILRVARSNTFLSRAPSPSANLWKLQPGILQAKMITTTATTTF